MAIHQICIHGHFYQPPRENVWLEEVQSQASAYPYHDWNQRISFECYEGNAFAHLLDSKGRIRKIVNNYERMSYNFGPTLLCWLERNETNIYQKILEADRKSQHRFSGHGSAIAQAYNHIIMPLANLRDKHTQIIWGIRDFEFRYGRRPEGLWLPETAVDMETLIVLAEHKIHFTILNPNQAKQVRPIGASTWQAVEDIVFDTTMPYLQKLPEGKEIVIFFYHQDLSNAAAFGNMLNNGDGFVSQIMESFDQSLQKDQLVHIAMDGETYGHHRFNGEKVLAHALDLFETQHVAHITNYGEYLEKHPPTHEVTIVEKSSWSCSHGVKRWYADCGCQSGSIKGWHQAWRGPLRRALDWLRDKTAVHFNKQASKFFKDPWQVRDRYIDVILQRTLAQFNESIRPYLYKKKDVTVKQRVEILKLLEMQRHAMLMYTSCGWFFDELSGVETVQLLQHAARVIQLYMETSGADIRENFLQKLQNAPSNLPQYGNGRRIFEQMVQPNMIDLKQVAAHATICALFYPPENNTVYAYQVTQRVKESSEKRKAKFSLGVTNVTSEITYEQKSFNFGILYLGGPHLFCGIALPSKIVDDQKIVQELTHILQNNDNQKAIKVLEHYFSPPLFTFSAVFADEQQQLVDTILDKSINNAIERYRKINADNLTLLEFLSKAAIPIPAAFSNATAFVLNHDLNTQLRSIPLKTASINCLFENAKFLNIKLDIVTLAHILRNTLEEMSLLLCQSPDDPKLLKDLLAGVRLALKGPLHVNLNRLQQFIFELSQKNKPEGSLFNDLKQLLMIA
ncbi:MAG: DUF3536 domain-containing protein [Desulfobacteraceae bacterium]